MNHLGTFGPTTHGSRYGGSGTIGGMSELSYSISDAGTHAHMTASGISGGAAPNYNPTASSQANYLKQSKVDQCLDEFLSDVVVGHNQRVVKQQEDQRQQYRDTEEPLNDLEAR